MSKAKIHDAGPFTPGLLEAAVNNLRDAHDPVTVFRFGNWEFALTLRKVGGRRVHTKAELLLMERIKSGQDDLNAKERLMARRILARKS